MILVPLPDHPYYLWQALVQAVYLRERGWPVAYLVYCQGSPSDRLRALMGAGLADWHVWPDCRTVKDYNAAMKPWLVGKYLTAHPDAGSVLVLDPDALPLRPWPDAVPGVLLGTDTDSYTGPAYLQSKGAWGPLCDMVGVDPDHAARFPGVGAQYVADLPGHWWEGVSDLSVEAFRLLSAIPAPEGDPHPVQAWCAEMYVTQLAAIRDGIEPVAGAGMGMVWANGSRAGWGSEGFFHDAGQTVEDGRHFCKITHQSSPWGKPLPVDPDSASALYVDLIRRVAGEHPGLVWR